MIDFYKKYNIFPWINFRSIGNHTKTNYDLIQNTGTNAYNVISEKETENWLNERTFMFIISPGNTTLLYNLSTGQTTNINFGSGYENLLAMWSSDRGWKRSPEITSDSGNLYINLNWSPNENYLPYDLSRLDYVSFNSSVHFIEDESEKSPTLKSPSVFPIGFGRKG